MSLICSVLRSAGGGTADFAESVCEVKLGNNNEGVLEMDMNQIAT